MTTTMTLSTARHIADSLIDTRIFRSEDDIIAAFDAIDKVYGTDEAEVKDLARMARLRKVGGGI